MTVPDYQSLMLPVLKAIANGKEAPTKEIRNRIANAEGLTQDDLRELLPSGTQTVFVNRVAWAISYMEHAGLVKRVRRGVYVLTDDGKTVLEDPPLRVDLKYLQNYPAFSRWRTRKNAPLSDKPPVLGSTADTSSTPEETLEQIANELRAILENKILDLVRNATPEFLERVVVDLLIAMGYGGGNSIMGQVTGRSGDGGIDGKIREDALGLDEVYVQAKKYTASNVGEGELRNFAGAIDASGTTKGVFVTTSDFTRSAREYVKLSPKRIVLIDGKELARLMVLHDVGVRMLVRHEVKRIDQDYFSEPDLV